MQIKLHILKTIIYSNMSLATTIAATQCNVGGKSWVMGRGSRAASTPWEPDWTKLYQTEDYKRNTNCLWKKFIEME